MQLNTSHPLYPSLLSCIGVNDANKLVDLVTPRTFTMDEGVVVGAGALGRHVKTSRSGDYAPLRFGWSPAIGIDAQSCTVFIAVNSFIGGRGNGAGRTALQAATATSETQLGLTPSAPSAQLAAWFYQIPQGAGFTTLSPTGTIVGNGSHSFTSAIDSSGYGVCLDGDTWATGVETTASRAGNFCWAGGRPGQGVFEAEFVWIAVFNRRLTAEEVEDLHASLGADNAFALVSPSGAPDPTPPSGTVTIGTITPSSTSASVTYSYSAGDATGFEYRLDGGAAASIGASPATISGLTASTTYAIEIRAVNASGASAWWSASANFTTGVPSGDTDPPTLTGTITFSSVTQTSYTASWPAGSDNVAIAGYEYQIGAAGAWTDAGNSLSAAISGRTAGTTETVYVRAYDAAGLRSTPAISGSVTLLSASTDGTIMVGSALYPIKYSSASVLNESGLRATVLDATTLAEVLNTSGVVCTNGVITITDAALVIGNTYHLAVKTANGWLGVSDGVTAS